MSENIPRPLQLTDVILVAEKLYNLPPGSILRTDRHQHIVDVRRMLAFIGRAWFDLTFPQIGKVMKRDHSTIMYHHGEMLKLIRQDRSRLQDIRKVLAAAEAKVGGRLSERAFNTRMRIALDDEVRRRSEPVEEVCA